jgi:hypothetical protein
MQKRSLKIVHLSSMYFMNQISVKQRAPLVIHTVDLDTNINTSLFSNSFWYKYQHLTLF